MIDKKKRKVDKTMAVYRPILMSPSTGETRNMLESQVFSATLTSKTTNYQIRIYNNNLGTLLYDSTKLTLPSVLHSGDELSHTVPITAGLATVRELKWTIQVWNNAETIDISQLREIFFKNYGNASVSLVVPATITTQKHLFTGIYSQPQNIDPFRYRYLLFDSNDMIVQDTGWIYKESLTYEFSGFLSPTDYQIKLEVYDTNDKYAESPIYPFSVLYESPSVNFQPEISNSEEDSAIEVKWSGAYSLPGTLDGTGIYIRDYLEYNNFGFDLAADSSIQWDGVNISKDYTYLLTWTPKSEITGLITKLENSETNHFYEIGFDFEAQKFYRNIDGVTTYTDQSFQYAATYVYLIGLQYDKLYIKALGSSKPWVDFLPLTWGDLTVYTWEDVLQGI